MLIGIAGPTASGKTTVAKMLENEFGAFQMRYSHILEEIAKRSGRPTDKTTLQQIYIAGQRKFGDDFLTKLLAEKISDVDSKLVVVEGNRMVADIELLLNLADKNAEELRLIFLDASFETRFERHNARLRANGSEAISREAFEVLENHPCEVELPEVKQLIEEHGTVLSTDDLTTEAMLQAVVLLFELS